MTSSRRRILLALSVGAMAVSLLSSCATTAASGLAGDDHLIVPGERVGPIRLGMSEQELLQLGTPQGPEPVPLYISAANGSGQQLAVPGIRYKFGGKMIWVYLERTSRRVVQIDLGYHGNCGDYHTEERVRCGAAGYYSLVGAFGDPDKRRNWDFGNHQVMRTTYFNNRHVPRSLTVFNFDPGTDMSVAPVDNLQDVSLYEGEYGNYFRAGN
jgi:hypothetical protein